jgi:hypothetical protein
MPGVIVSELVESLSQGDHAVEISVRPERSAAALKRCLDKGYFHLIFTETRGSTQLCVVLDAKGTDLSGADFDAGAGWITLTGRLQLDFVDVRCLARIDLETLSGRGRLERTPLP